MKKRAASVLLALLMIFSLLPVEALAQEPDTADATVQQEEPAALPPEQEEQAEQALTSAETTPLSAAETSSGTGAVYTGTLGENVSWSLDTGTGALTVTGSGPMGDYTYTNAQSTSPLWNYRSYIKTVTIADTVTTVGSWGFYGCANLTTVDFGSGVTKIGSYAFDGCKALTEMVISDSVTSIGDFAFCNCEALPEMVIPNGVTSIGSYAFKFCYSLTTVTMGSGVTFIGGSAFYNCNKLNKVIIPDTTAWLKISFENGTSNPFYSAYALYLGDELLTDLVIPGTITEINQYAFNGCTSITSVYIPQSVKSIGQYAFYGMSSLKTVRYAGSQSDWLNIKIGSYNDSLTGLTPQYDQSLADYCRITTAATEHGTVAVDNAMVKVGDTVTITAIPAPGYAVESYLVDGTAIPDGGNTFTATKDHVVSATFTKVYDVADNGKACGDCGANIKWALDTEGTLHVYGTGAMGDYNCGDSPFYPYRASIKAVQFSGNITTIGECAFYECSNLTELIIPNSVTSIGNSAFLCRGHLTEIVIPASVTSIGDRAFDGCSLTSAEFLGNAPTLGRNAFGYDPSNFTIFYHSSTTGWTSPKWNGYNTVCRDKITTDFSTLDNDNRNGQGVYFQLNPTAMIATVGKNTTADNNAGYDGSQNGSIVIPDTVTKGDKTYNVIGVNQYAFANCPWVSTVSLGQYVSAIEPSAFRGCKNLTAITVDANNLQFADQDGVLFDKCGLYLYAYPAGRAAATYDIPDTCDTVGAQSFYGAANLTSLTVPTSVKNIGAKAFAQCNALEEVVLPFFGGNAESSAGIGFVFDGFDYSYNKLPESLKKITVYKANLYTYAFATCSALEEIYLPDCGKLEYIPVNCFYNCTSLHTLSFGSGSLQNGMVVIPDSVITIQENAFRGCESIRGITLGRGTTTLDDGAFAHCTGMEQFAVAKGNTTFMADQWGVLYSKDQTLLHYYPAGRAWPYYNVNAVTTTIGSYAFSSCKNLVNLFIPESVVSFGTSYYTSKSCIINCPSTTICCYLGSAAARYAIENNLTPWYMDNHKLQGIKVSGLPEYTVVNAQGELLSSVHVTALYDNKELQLDDYTIQPVSGYGEQTLFFSSGSVTTTVTANVVRQGNINGAATAQGDIDAGDMQCLYTYLTTGENEGQIQDAASFRLISDVNNDGSVDVYDLQHLYETVRGIR